jgi:methyl-accepting chemotaxis protein
MSGYFRWLLLALVISLALILGVTATKGLPPIAALAPVAPLVLYHVLFLRPRAKTLPGSAVDSVYYFGFLVTVGELAATAFKIAGSEQSGLNAVLYNFGAGLLATGYAVIARLDLQNLAKSATPASTEQALEHYLRRSGVLLDNLDLTIQRFGQLAETALTETQRIAECSREQIEASAKAATSIFADDMRASLKSVRESVDGIRVALSDANFTQEREALSRALRQTVDAAGELASKLLTLSERAEASSGPLQGVGEQMRQLTGSAATLGEELRQLSGESGTLNKVAANMESASLASERAAISAGDACRGVDRLSQAIQGSSEAFDEVRRSTNTISKSFDSLGGACVRLESSVMKLGEALKTSEQFADSLERTGRDLPELTPKLQTLGQEFDVLRRALGTTAASLESDVQRSTRAVGLLADNLAEVAETIVERTKKRHAGV